MFLTTGVLKCSWEELAKSMNAVQNWIFFVLIEEILENLMLIETKIERRAVILALSSVLKTLEGENRIYVKIVNGIRSIVNLETDKLNRTVYSNGLVDFQDETTLKVSSLSNK